MDGGEVSKGLFLLEVWHQCLLHSWLDCFCTPPLGRCADLMDRQRCRLTRLLSIAIEVLGFLAELSLCLWLLVMGVNVERWTQQASATRSSDGASGSDPA